eukprot:1178892-Prorocentrum_minimum.AAC.9
MRCSTHCGMILPSGQVLTRVEARILQPRSWHRRRTRTHRVVGGYGEGSGAEAAVGLALWDAEAGGRVAWFPSAHMGYVTTVGSDHQEDGPPSKPARAKNLSTKP